MFLRKISLFADKFARFVSMATLFLIFLIVFGSAVLRYGFKLNILSSYDWARVMFVWFAFFGMTVVYRQKEHSNFTFIIDRFKGNSAKFSSLFINIVALFFFSVIAYTGALLSLAARQQQLPASGLSAFWLYIPISLGAAIAVIHSLFFIFSSNKEPQK